MPKLSLPAKLFVAGALALVAVAGVGLLAHRPARAQDLSQSVADEKVAKAWEKFYYEPAKACMECHTFPIKARDKALDLVMLTEYAIWQTHDKHAQAYAVLKGPRGKQIAEVLKKDVLKADAGCLNCHAQNNLIEENKAKKAGVNLELEDGISCGGCHGPSGGEGSWHGDHAIVNGPWRKKTAEEKFKRGMRDLRDPVVRAELCLSCHVGNAAEGKVVTHAMMAAGHPPLPPFEIATFSKNQPQHWRDAAKVPAFAK